MVAVILASLLLLVMCAICVLICQICIRRKRMRLRLQNLNREVLQLQENMAYDVEKP